MPQMIDEYEGGVVASLLSATAVPTAVPVADDLIVEATPYLPSAPIRPLEPLALTPSTPVAETFDAVKLSVSGQRGVHAISGHRGQDGGGGGGHGTAGTDASYPTEGENAGRLIVNLSAAPAASIEATIDSASKTESSALRDNVDDRVSEKGDGEDGLQNAVADAENEDGPSFGRYTGAIAVRFTSTGVESQASKMNELVYLSPAIKHQANEASRYPTLAAVIDISAVGGAGGNGGNGGDGGCGGHGRPGHVREAL
jgi:hypothetical protein